MLYLSQQHSQSIRAHAEQTYPSECCGLLLGQVTQQAETTVRTVVELWAAQNSWNAETAERMDELLDLSQSAYDPIDPSIEGSMHSSIHNQGDRYWIDPLEMLAAMKYGRDRQLDIIGVYHSHPDHPAVPSECDRAIAWPQYSYIIVSVYQGSAQDLLSWNLDKNHCFQAEPLICPDREMTR